MRSSSLYIVATPIGNLSDITLRAIEILKSVDFIAAEDTRHSQRLLSHYGIDTPCFSLHDFNEDSRIHKIIGLLSDGKSVALISDAGTPLISDPGFRLVRAVLQENHRVIPIPGACAAIAGLVASGLPTDRFRFEGFLPAKSSAQETQLQKLKNETCTLIFYESVHRIDKTIALMKAVLGENRMVTLARELTKSFETIIHGEFGYLSEWMSQHPEQRKGEFVIIVQGAEEKTNSNDEQLYGLLEQLLTELTVKQSVSLAAKITGLNANGIYALALKIKNKG